MTRAAFSMALSTSAKQWVVYYRQRYPRGRAGEQRDIAFALQGVTIGHMQQLLRLIFRQPVTHTGTVLLRALHSSNGARHLGIEQAVVRGFAGQLAQCGERQVDAAGGQAAAL